MKNLHVSVKVVHEPGDIELTYKIMEGMREPGRDSVATNLTYGAGSSNQSFGVRVAEFVNFPASTIKVRVPRTSVHVLTLGCQVAEHIARKIEHATTGIVQLPVLASLIVSFSDIASERKEVRIESEGTEIMKRFMQDWAEFAGAAEGEDPMVVDGEEDLEDPDQPGYVTALEQSFDAWGDAINGNTWLSSVLASM